MFPNFLDVNAPTPEGRIFRSRQVHVVIIIPVLPPHQHLLMQQYWGRGRMVERGVHSWNIIMGRGHEREGREVLSGVLATSSSERVRWAHKPTHWPLLCPWRYNWNGCPRCLKQLQHSFPGFGRNYHIKKGKLLKLLSPTLPHPKSG